MPSFTITSKSRFNNENKSVSELPEGISKAAPVHAKREQLLKRQQKVQHKFLKTMMRQQIEREKLLHLLKQTARCPSPPAYDPPPRNSTPCKSPPQIQKECTQVSLPTSLKQVASRSPCNSTPGESPPQDQQKCTNKLYKQQPAYVQLLSSLKKVASRRTPPACIPSPPNSSPSNPTPSYPSNPPPEFSPPCASSKEPPYTTHFTVSHVNNCYHELPQDFFSKKAMRKQKRLLYRCPKIAFLSSDEQLKVKCKSENESETRNLCCRCLICCMFLSIIILGWSGFAILILAGLRTPPSLSTCAQCDFCFEPPKLSASTLKRQTPCLGLDKLIQEERDNQEWNVAFQKALVKRLEASERRITLDDYLGDDDDDGGPRTKRHKKDNKEKVKEKVVQVKEKGKKDKSVDKPEEVFKEKKCPCSWKIKSEERKRKAFVRIMEREQVRFEKRSLRAQRKYDKERQKAYKRCELTQLAMEKGYFKRNKDGVVDKAEETFSVFIHMDPGHCACRGKAARLVKFKKCFFKFCVWFYVVGFITFFVTSYFLTKF